MGEWDRIIDLTLTFVIVTFIITLTSVILVPIYVRDARDKAQKFFDTLPELDDLVVLVNGTIPESYFTDAMGKIRLTVRSEKICWDANNNIPLLQDNCIPGAYYIVTTPGTTILGPHGGVLDPWYIGTQLVCTGGGWIKIEPDNLEYPADMNVPGGIAGLDLSGLLFPWQIPVLFLQGMSFLGGWNANTNTPALFSGLCINGDIYVVTVAGNTIIDGQGTWEVGEAVVCDGVNSFFPFWKRVSGMFFSLSEVLAAGEITDIGGSIIMGTSPVLSNPIMPKSLTFTMPSYEDCVPNGCQIVAIATDGLGHLYSYGVIPFREHTAFFSKSNINNFLLIQGDWFNGPPPSSPNTGILVGGLTLGGITGFTTNQLIYPTTFKEFFYNFDHGIINLNLNPTKSWAFSNHHAQVWRTVNFKAIGKMNKNLITGQYNAAFGPSFRIRLSNFKPGPFHVQGMAMRINVSSNPSISPSTPRSDIIYSYLVSNKFAMPCNDVGIEESVTIPGEVLIHIKCWPIRFTNQIDDSNFALDKDQIVALSIRITHTLLT